MMQRVVNLLIVVLILIPYVHTTDPSPFGTDWEKIEEDGAGSGIDEASNEEEQITAKEQVATWVLHGLERIILKEIRETSFTQLITGKPDEDPQTTMQKRNEASSAYLASYTAGVIGLLAFLVGVLLCLWCTIVRHVFRGAVYIFVGVLCLFLLVLFVYPSGYLITA